MQMTYKGFLIESKYLGNKNWDMCGCDVSNRNNHKVTVKNLKTGKWTWFEFWQSNAIKDITTESQLIEAFWCFLWDAQAGMQSYADFCDEFGWDRHDKHTRTIYNKVKVARNKAERIFEDMDEVITMGNEIQEEYNL